MSEKDCKLFKALEVAWSDTGGGKVMISVETMTSSRTASFSNPYELDRVIDFLQELRGRFDESKFAASLELTGKERFWLKVLVDRGVDSEKLGVPIGYGASADILQGIQQKLKRLEELTNG